MRLSPESLKNGNLAGQKSRKYTKIRQLKIGLEIVEFYVQKFGKNSLNFEIWLPYYWISSTWSSVSAHQLSNMSIQNKKGLFWIISYYDSEPII